LVYSRSLLSDRKKLWGAGRTYGLSIRKESPIILKGPEAHFMFSSLWYSAFTLQQTEQQWLPIRNRRLFCSDTVTICCWPQSLLSTFSQFLTLRSKRVSMFRSLSSSSSSSICLLILFIDFYFFYSLFICVSYRQCTIFSITGLT